MPPSVARAILRQLTASYGVAISEDHVLDEGGEPVRWRVAASHPSGECWRVEADEYAAAVTRLATLLGFDLTDG